MKRPDVYKWLGTVEREKNQWKDWNGKQSYDYFVHIPEWLARAYHLDMEKVIVTIFAERQSFHKMRGQTTNNEYFRANWLRKQTKKIKINHNYIAIKVLSEGSSSLLKKCKFCGEVSEEIDGVLACGGRAEEKKVPSTNRSTRQDEALY